jgi:small subunit ribosomal protein S20
MANIKSAIKRIDITKRNTLENRRYSSNVKTYTKKWLTVKSIKRLKEMLSIRIPLHVKNLIYEKH